MDNTSTCKHVGGNTYVVTDCKYPVYVRDFDDGYHDQIPSDKPELEQRVRQNKTKCRTLEEYWKSRDDYEEYMLYLLEKYVPFDYEKFPKRALNVLHLMIQGGMIKEFVPQEPLPIGKELKKKVKKGIRYEPSNEYEIRENTPEFKQAWAEYRAEMQAQHDEEYARLSKKEKKKRKKEDDKELADIVAQMNKRRKKMLTDKHVPLQNQVDMLAELRSIEKANHNKSLIESKYPKQTITNLMREDWYLYDRECIEEMEAEKAYRGSHQEKIDEERQQREIFDTLHRLGWNSYRIRKRMGICKYTYDAYRTYAETDKPCYVWTTEAERRQFEEAYEDAISRDEDGKKKKKKKNKKKDKKEMLDFFSGKKKKKKKKGKKKDKGKKKKKEFKNMVADYLMSNAEEIFNPTNPYAEKFTDQITL